MWLMVFTVEIGFPVFMSYVKIDNSTSISSYHVSGLKFVLRR